MPSRIQQDNRAYFVQTEAEALATIRKNQDRARRARIDEAEELADHAADGRRQPPAPPAKVRQPRLRMPWKQ